METVFVSGIGEVPAKPAKDLKVGDKVIISYREMGSVTNLEYDNEYVRIGVTDNTSHTDYSLHRRKSNLIGVLPKE